MGISCQKTPDWLQSPQCLSAHTFPANVKWVVLGKSVLHFHKIGGLARNIFKNETIKIGKSEAKTVSPLYPNMCQATKKSWILQFHNPDVGSRICRCRQRGSVRPPYLVFKNPPLQFVWCLYKFQVEPHSFIPFCALVNKSLSYLRAGSITANGNWVYIGKLFDLVKLLSQPQPCEMFVK